MAQGRGFNNSVVVGKETTYGTKASAFKSIGIMEEFSVEESNNTDVARSIGRRGAHSLRQGGISTEFSMSLRVQNPEPFLMGLGKVVTTGASAPYTHTISLAQASDVPPSFTIQANDNGIGKAENLLGAKVDSMTLSASAQEALMVELEGLAQKSVAEPSPTAVALDLSTPYFTFFEGTLKVDGVAYPAVTEFEIEVSNNLESRFTLNGDKYPARIEEGGTDIEGSLTADLIDDVLIQKFRSGARVDLELKFVDSTTPTRTLTITVPDVVFDNKSIDTSAEDLKEIEIDYIGTDVTIVFVNTQAQLF